MGISMSYAHYFRVKAELYEMLLEKGENNAIDRSWYQGLVRSYKLLAAAEDRHYYSGLKAVPAGNASAALEFAPAADLEGDIALVVQSQIKRTAA